LSQLSHLIRSTAALHDITRSVRIRDFYKKSEHVLHVTYKSVFNQIVSLSVLRREVQHKLVRDGKKLGPYGVTIDSITFRGSVHAT
jgi:hypothetical protein